VIRSSLICAAALGAALVAAGCGSGGGSSPGPADYRVDIYDGWPPIVKHKRVGGYLESSWYDVPGVPITISIDTRRADETGSPAASADLARIQTTKLPGYRERGMRWIRLGGRPVLRWSFDVPGDQSRIEYFFEECGISFVVRGSMETEEFKIYAESTRAMTKTIEVPDCDE
jgi:hypothetical protein